MDNDDILLETLCESVKNGELSLEYALDINDKMINDYYETGNWKESKRLFNIKKEELMKKLSSTEKEYKKNMEDQKKNRRLLFGNAVNIKPGGTLSDDAIRRNVRIGEICDKRGDILYKKNNELESKLDNLRHTNDIMNGLANDKKCEKFRKKQISHAWKEEQKKKSKDKDIKESVDELRLQVYEAFELGQIDDNEKTTFLDYLNLENYQ